MACQKFYFILSFAIDALSSLQISSLHSNKNLPDPIKRYKITCTSETHVMSKREKNQKDDGKRFQFNWLGWTMQGSILLTYDFNSKAKFAPQSSLPQKESESMFAF